MLGVVGIVVDGSHRSQLVEALNQHTLRVHIGKAERAYHLRHPLGASPGCNGIEEGTRHLHIVDEIDPTEAHTLAIPPFVGAMVDDAGNTTYHLTVAISHEIFGLAELKGSILVLTQRVTLVAIKVGSIKLVATIQVVVELDKGIQLALVGHFPNLYCRHLSVVCIINHAKIRKKWETPKILTYFTANIELMGSILGSCGKNVDVAAIPQFQFLTQLLNGHREVTNGNISLTDACHRLTELLLVHR